MAIRGTSDIPPLNLSQNQIDPGRDVISTLRVLPNSRKLIEMNLAADGLSNKSFLIIVYDIADQYHMIIYHGNWSCV